MTACCDVRIGASFLAVLAFCLQVSHPAGAAEMPSTTDTGICKVIEPDQPSMLTVSWSGACDAGFANGEGELRWFRKGKPTATFTGTLNAGRLNGSGNYRYANGDRYRGGFSLNLYDGNGVYTFANGNLYVGTFSAGQSTRSGTLLLTNGNHFETDLVVGRTHSLQRFVAPPILFVVCFSAGGQFTSSTMVRKSGVVRYDDIVASIVKVRAIAGEKLVGEPLAGCHMLGVGISPGEYVLFFNDAFDPLTEVVITRCQSGCTSADTGWLP